MRRTKLLTLGPAVVSASLLAGVLVQSRYLPKPADAEPYHAMVKSAAVKFPLRVGYWKGTDAEVTSDALGLLNPNVIISRSYKHELEGWSIGFLLVHCRNAKDLDGHYPPICYPGQGYVQALSSRYDECKLDNEPVPMTRYTFELRSTRGDEVLIVYNFIIMPDGRIMADQSGVKRAAGDYLRHFFGAGQVQVVFRDPRMTEADREEALQLFVAASRDAIRAIRQGVQTP